MKRFLSIMLVALFAYLGMTMVLDNQLIPEFGKSLTEKTVSEQYISKSVTANSETVEYGKTENAESGSANLVTSIVANYRSFDTLGEVTVLFISAMGVSLMVGTSDKLIERSESGFILKTGARILTPILLVVGIYVITHGHITPGGGFQGGSMIASSVLLLILSDKDFVPVTRKFKILEGVSGSIYILIGLAGMATTGYFLKNFVATGTVGELFSAGLIPVIYLFIGLKVGSELTGILADFLKKEANV